MSGKAVVTENPLPVITFGYGYRRTITVNPAQVAGGSDLIDFPLLVKYTHNDLKSTTNGGKVISANGYDIAFTDASYNPLRFELNSYNPGTGEVIAWVRVPVLSSSVGTDIHMLYGKAGITTNLSSPDTWPGDYVQVMHLDNNDFTDATAFGNFGVNSGTSAAGGKIGTARSFDGVNNMIVVSDDPDLDGTNDEATFSLWINWVNSANGSTYQRIMTSSNRLAVPLMDGL